ncbi:MULTISPECIES: TolC family protein [unclassified Chitinophaga]|uniref:TolC family protein n=1 Tax=unclassified Chitinophaga TaxID=2619133 RepID=UPI0009F8F210|nr:MULTISPECIES: TolC family protein [unclassified Chitinophaga]WPV66145.1 TolC family protein [Chitinophaga sp. LS1]
MINKNRRTLRLLLLSAGLIVSSVSPAQQIFTLNQCLDTALKNSLQIQSDQYGLEKTKADVGQAYSSLLPNISASGYYQYQFKVPVQMIPADLFGGTPGTYQAAQFSVPQTKSGSLDISQTIFNASSLIALKAAKVSLNINQLQIQSSKEDLVYNVSATYYNIQTILKQIELTTKNLSNTEELLQSTSDQYKSGLATETDVDRLFVSRDNTKADLETASNNLDKEYNVLKLFMNVPLDTKLTVSEYEDNQPLISPEPPGLDIMKKTDYLQVLENRHLAEIQRKNIKAGYLPSLTLSGNYGISAFYSNANPFNNLNDKWYSSSSFKVALSIPIFDGFSKKYQIKNKSIAIKQYDIQAEQIKQQSLKNVANANADLKTNILTLQAKKRNLNLAQKVLDDIKLQYQNGIAKITDVINSQSELYTAQNNYIKAIINIKQAELELKKAQGTLLNQ